MSTACVIIIGNEILSGRTQDINLNWLAKELNETGVKLREARVIPDVPETIVATVNECRNHYDYVFTTGGIGPTHDDITAENIARAFGVNYSLNKEAEEILVRYYQGREHLNAARLKMAYMPEGVTLIPNPVSGAPGFQIGNVYVMAGVPRIMQAMFNHVRGTLNGGKPTLSDTISVYLTEGVIAEGLTAIQEQFQDVEIGSYPFIRSGKLGTSLVSRHESKDRLNVVHQTLIAFINSLNGELSPEDF